MELILPVIKCVLSLFLALILTYCIGRMFGLGFFKSFERHINPPASLRDTTAEGEKKDGKSV